MILAGDIGGTNTRLALFDLRRGRLRRRRDRSSRMPAVRAWSELVREFLDGQSHRIETACFGVAGPVRDGRVKLTNLQWMLEEKGLSPAR